MYGAPVGIVPTPDGGGYWLVLDEEGVDVGVASFGDAATFASMGVTTPVVGGSA